MSQVTAPRLQRRSHAEVEQQRRVLEMAKVVASTVGQSFFQTLVEHLATGGAVIAFM